MPKRRKKRKSPKRVFVPARSYGARFRWYHFDSAKCRKAKPHMKPLTYASNARNIDLLARTLVQIRISRRLFGPHAGGVSREVPMETRPKGPVNSVSGTIRAAPVENTGAFSNSDSNGIFHSSEETPKGDY